MASPSVYTDRRYVMNAVSGGLKVDTGSFTPAAATGTVTTQLSNVVGVFLTMDNVDATHAWNSADPAGGNANQFTWKAWKPTSATDPTPVAATTPWNKVYWVAVGT